MMIRVAVHGRHRTVQSSLKLLGSLLQAMCKIGTRQPASCDCALPRCQCGCALPRCQCLCVVGELLEATAVYVYVGHNKHHASRYCRVRHVLRNICSTHRPSHRPACWQFVTLNGERFALTAAMLYASIIEHVMDASRHISSLICCALLDIQAILGARYLTNARRAFDVFYYVAVQ
jgi:hypothetical protein